MDPKRLVAEGYDRLYETYAAWTSRPDGPRRRYIDWVLTPGLRFPASALDLGCGTGRHGTAYLVERGFAVTGVDISPASIAKARQEVPAARFQVADMATVEIAPDSFDLITAFYSLIHLPKEEHAGVLARIATWLRPGGYVVVNTAGGGEPWTGVDDAWLDLAPMYWSHWDVSTSLSLATAAGLDVLSAEIETTTEDDKEVSFLWLVARKPARGE